MEIINTKLRKTVKYIFLPAFFIFFIYYYADIIQNPFKQAIERPRLNYILQWTSPDTEPFKFMGKGQENFKKLRCPVNNCYITANREYLKKVTDFDVVLFHGPELHRTVYELPQNRSSHQKYVFVSMESCHYYPIKEERYDNYFNWTWTYKLDSDLYYGYIVIRNKKGEIIGPKIDMNWLKAEEMLPISNKLKEKLSAKNKIAAWFVSNCHSLSKREDLVEKIQEELATHDFEIDIYGKCSPNSPNNKHVDSMDLVGEYYFYLSFENSFGEDYVTEKLLNAIQNNAVPVVFGGANYTRFLPDGAYLDARKLGAEEVAKQMMHAMIKPENYYDFFRWRNHYSYHRVEEHVETNYYCALCAKANEHFIRNEASVFNDFLKWWNCK